MQVVPINPALAEANKPSERERRLRRIAMQIVVQLPEDERDALDVLRAAKDLIRGV